MALSLPHPAEGRLLVRGTAFVLAVAAAAAIGMAAEAVDGVRSIVRLTARLSFALFLLAYTASALAVLVPSAATRWQRRNRRYLGLSFALSHGVHALVIIGLVALDPALFWRLTNVGSVLSAGIAYLFILAMAVTSFPATAAALGPRWWRILHTAGIHYVWISFLAAFGKRAAADPSYASAVVLLGIALLLRLGGWRRSRSNRAPAPAA